MAGLYTVRSMGVTWKKNPPFPHKTTYAKHLLEYADNAAEDVAGQAPDDESWEEWLRKHEERSRADPYERVGNGIIALRMLPLFENNPEGWNAIRRLPASEVRIGEFLTQWKEAADPQDRELIQRIEGRCAREASKQRNRRSNLADVEHPRAQVGPVHLDEAQTVEPANSRPGVDIPPVPGALDLLDRLVAVHERRHALDGSSPVATNPVRREGETEQSHIRLAPTFEYRRRDRHRGRREPVPGVGRCATA